MSVESYVRHGVMDTQTDAAPMGRTTIQVSEELADELHDRKARGDSYEDVIWRLIEAAEREHERTVEEIDERVAAGQEPVDAALGANGIDIEELAGDDDPPEGWGPMHDSIYDWVRQHSPMDSHAKEAVMAAWTLLHKEGDATSGELKNVAYQKVEEHNEDASTLWDSIESHFEEVPGVEKVGSSDWKYSGDETAKKEMVGNG